MRRYSLISLRDQPHAPRSPAPGVSPCSPNVFRISPRSVIREMTRLANRHNAVNLGQGMPDFEAPQALKDAAAKAIQDGFNQYAITWGTLPLRQAIAAKARRVNGIEAEPDKNITVCCGATEAMMATMLALINPGDEVIIFQPFYENYRARRAWSPAASRSGDPHLQPKPELDLRPR